MNSSSMSQQISAPAATTQRQFWLLQQLQPDTTAYNIAGQFEIAGPLDLAALRGAFEDLARRHATLRTTFEQHADGLLQRIEAEPHVDFQIEDVSRENAQQYVDAALARRFDLRACVPWQVRIARLEPEQHTLIWTMHHSIVDLASKELFATELASAYQARLAALGTRTAKSSSAPNDPTHGAPPEGRGVPQASECSSLVEFTSEEAEYFASEAHERAKAYFLDHVRGRSPQLGLPEDTPRPRFRPLRGARIGFDVASDVCERLNRRCSELTTKPFLWLLTAWGITLARFASSDHVVVGVPFSNRRNWRAKHAAGCFVRTLPVVIETPMDLPFGQVLSRVRMTMLGHHRHQEIDPGRLLADLGLPHDAARNPIYQAGFTFEPPMSLVLDGARVSSVKAHCGGTQLDVFLTLWPTSSGFSGQLEYATELFGERTAQRFLDGFLTLLADSVENDASPNVAASRLRVLSERERHEVVEVFNATAVDYSPPNRLYQLFLDQARRCSEATAVRFEDEETSYGELVAKARGLAARLRASGLLPGEHVGVYMVRSREMVLSILGILMASGVYLPLDPDYPSSRIEQMLEDARPRMVLTHAETDRQWPSRSMARHVVSIDECPVSMDDPPELPIPNDAAYTIFTSGSTGRPKGATNTHRGIINRILWMQDAFHLDATDVVLQKTPFSFDVSTWEFFWPLAVGAVMQIAAPGVHRDPGALCRLIRATRVTTIHFVPSMLDAFLGHPLASGCVSLKRIFASGEALGADLVRRCTTALRAELHNLYGPTEAAVDVTWWPCDATRVPAQIPIGKPIANTQAYILDSAGNPVPIGVHGELYIGGVQVAVGYVNRPELTQERFLPDPFSTGQEGRLYRTGDLAKWLPDGNIAFLGRADYQVKLRGNRIELGEIESVLQQCLGIDAAIVVVSTADAGQPTLVAYLRRAADAAPDAALISEARARTSAALPQYMVPAHFIVLDAFPLTASGKIDRRRLPVPAVSTPDAAPPVLPSTSMQAWLVEQIGDLIGVPQVSAAANLFELGGSSITVAQLVGRVYERWKLEVPLVKFFEHPSVDRMAQYLAQQLEGKDATSDGLDLARAKAKLKRERANALQRSRR